MDLKNLNTFIQVAELNSFTRAAEKLGYSQPTVSLQIKQLESEIGRQLFDRIGHTVSLTDAGHEALAYAQRICHLSEEMILGTADPRKPEGLVRLAMADSLCTQLAAKCFREIRECFPSISLRITTGGTGALFDMLDHNEADIVCTLDSHIYNSTYVIAHEEKIGVHFIVPASHPFAQRPLIELEELTRQPVLMTERNMSYGRLLSEHLARHSLEIQPVLETGSADAICRLVEEGMGIAFLPDYVTAEAVRRGSVRRLQIQGFEPELWKQLLYHRDKWVSASMQAIIGHLSNVLLQDTLN